MKFLYLPILIFFYFGLNLKLQASYKSMGVPFVTNYSKAQYLGGNQNWDIKQNNQGLIFIANNEGLLEFDGNNWHKMSVPNFSVVRSIEIINNDIYVGAYNEFGYFTKSANGAYHYNSLVDKIPDAYQNYGEVWNIFEFNNGVLFQTFKGLFYYKDESISIIEPQNEFHFSFLVNGQIYVIDKGIGICKVNGPKLELIKHGDYFAKIEVVGILYNEGQLIVTTALNGLFRISENGVEPWGIATNKLFKENQIFSTLQTTNGNLVFGTVKDGIYVLNSKGRLEQHINTQTGLQNNTVLSLFEGADQNIWAGLDNGVDYVEISSPFEIFPRDKDLGTGYASIKFKNYLYLGTNTGLYYRKIGEDNSEYDFKTNFKLVKNTSGQIWDLQVVDNQLICGHNKGTFLIKGEVGKLISDVEGGWHYLYREEFPNRMIGGTYTGLVLFEKGPETNNEWRFKQKIEDFDESSREMIWSDPSTIWMCHGYKGVYRIELNDDLSKCDSYRYYGTEDGFDSNLNINVHEVRDQLIFSSNNGFYSYVKELNRFEPNRYFNELFGVEDRVHRMFKLENGDIWFFQGDELGILKLQIDNSYKKIIKPFANIKGSFIGGFQNLSKIDQNTIIIGTEDGFVLYDPDVIIASGGSFKTYIRQVAITKSYQDSIVNFGISQNEPSVFSYENNSFNFEFSAPIYNGANQIKYQFQLIGYDERPSLWTAQIKKEYTNLPQGEYVFTVKAINKYGVESESDQYAFIILPPWYLSKFAFISYLIFVMLVSFVVFEIIRRRMLKIQINLKKKQAEELKLKDQQYREEALIAEKEIVKLRNDKLRSEVEFKNKELASSTMNIVHKNEVLTYAVNELKKTHKKIKDPTALKQVASLIKTIDSEFNNEQDWEQFEVHFDQVHENFIKNLRNSYPQLTPKDLRMCAYLRMNLSTKEIAPLMNISVRGVEISRYRLRKKMELNRDENLIDFLLGM